MPVDVTSRWAGPALLFGSFLAISSLGVAFDLEGGAEPVLKLFWKTTGTCCALVVVVVSQFVGRNGAWSFMEEPVDTLRRILLCAAGYTMWNASFNWALAHTSVGHVYLLNNCHSLLIVVWRALCCDSLALWEIAGTVVGISGSVITSMDSATPSTDAKIVEASIGGDLGAFLGAIGAVVYLLQAKTIRSRMGLMPFMLCHTFVVSVLLLPTMWLLGESFTLSRDPVHGLFGWINWEWDRVGLELYLVGICDFVGGMGYIRVMAYFDPLVVSIVMLLEPIVATLLGILAGVATVPGLVTCVGSVIVIAGTTLVIATNATPPKPKQPSPLAKAFKVASIYGAV
ncbi:Drug/Metabolite Transporter (DMT) Superfamily [Achlya hypogyna]|uniref:Drug/Metabolite Transporter (DMT) Superfamily n=1 Tax=Achlya hypogyna TaxID=1202772 RepID=A0A1V9YPM5_ACHHY|nr:Drug/Metabolite Transporter (DMT) Superfamily [Achlya hypogyna]